MKKLKLKSTFAGKPIKSAYFAPAMFMQNFTTGSSPRPLGDGTYSIFNFINPDKKVPLLDIVGDTGKFVGAILADPERYEGKVISSAENLYSMNEVARILSKSTGTTVKYNQIPKDVFRGFLPAQAADDLVEMFEHMNDYGYFGPQMQDLVEWGSKQARGKVTTLEEFSLRTLLNLSKYMLTKYL